MSSEPKDKIEKATANVAYQAAISAMATSKAYGALFNAILRALLNKDAISHAEVETVFLGAVAAVDEGEPVDDLQRAVRRHMRLMLQEAAQGFGIQIPLPGQTGIQRTQ